MPGKITVEELVEKFWGLHRRIGDYLAAWNELHEWCLSEASRRGLRSPSDSWRSASGHAFQSICEDIIRNAIANSPLSSAVTICQWDEAPSSIKEGILSELVWPKGEINRPQKVESQVDVIAILISDSSLSRVISVYSCKTSVAERYQQDLYWAEKLKARGIHFCFVTIDKGFMNFATGRTTRETPTKSIVLANALYDRIYLPTRSDIVRYPGVFRKIDTVTADLDAWIKAY